MAVPRVFVSSTCYDLIEIRDAIGNFCEGFGFDAVLSDKGDVFFHPDLHTHEACLFEIQNCHLLVLVIGGRFGGTYITEKNKSITNAEYAAARKRSIPIFCFVKQDVLDNHNLWQRNKGKPFSNQIFYPAIEKQEHANDIFEFIDEVRHSTVNNGFFGFKMGRDIENMLKKQLAGMFFDFLSKRSLATEIQTTNDAVQRLALVANSIEEVVKRIYRKDEEDPVAVIDALERTKAAENFFQTIGKILADKEFLTDSDVSVLSKTTDADWVSVFSELRYFGYGFDVETAASDVVALFQEPDKVLTFLDWTPLVNENAEVIFNGINLTEEIRRGWIAFISLRPDKRKEVSEGYRYANAPTAPVTRRRAFPKPKQ